MIKDYTTNELLFEGPYDARTHGYGGGQSVAYNGTIYFTNYLDDIVYEIRPGGNTPTALIGGQKAPGMDPLLLPLCMDARRDSQIHITGISSRRYADFDVHPVHPHFIAAVVEETGAVTVENSIVVIDTHTKQEYTVDLVSNHRAYPPSMFLRRPEFVDNPRFSPDGKRLAFRVW